MKIPFNKPFIAGKELYYIAQAVTLGNIAGDGHFTKQCSRLLEERFGIHKVLLTPSCTAALEMAAMLCNLGPGDEVIVPSFTFVSTANAFVRCGARPVFVDIRPDTLNIDDALIEDAITATDQGDLSGPLCRRGLRDGPHHDHRGRSTGSGRRGCRAGRERLLRRPRPGLDRPSGLPTASTKRRTISAARGRAVHQRPGAAPRGPRSSATKGPTASSSSAARWTSTPGSTSAPPTSPAKSVRPSFTGNWSCWKRSPTGGRRFTSSIAATSNRWKRTVCCDSRRRPRTVRAITTCFMSCCRTRKLRDALMNHLKASGIHAVFHYVPLHSSPMGQKFGYCEHDLPVTEDISGRLLRLPFYYEISNDEQVRVVEEIGRFYAERKSTRKMASLAGARG